MAKKMKSGIEAAAVYYRRGDAIRGERVAAQFRKIHKPRVTMGSGRHQIQRTKLEGNVFCVIELPMKPLRKG